MNAVQFDHQAFTAQDLANANSDQFALGAANARRLLAADDQHNDHAHTTVVNNVPRAALKQLASKEAQKNPKRHLLSTMMPVSDQLTSTAVMPQGPLKIQGTDTTGSFTSASTGGFIVQDGPVTTHTMSRDELTTDLAADGNSISDMWRWMERGSFEGVSQTFETMRIALSSDSFDYYGDMWSKERLRASIAVGPWIALFVVLIEFAAGHLIKMTPNHSSRAKALFAKRITEQQEQVVENTLKYSRSFFESPSYTVNFNDEKGTTQHVIGALFNEIGLIFCGYYLLALIFLAMCPGLVILFGIEHFAGCKLTDKNRPGFRYYSMRFVQMIFDKSITEEMATLICGGTTNANETMQKRLTHICRDGNRSIRNVFARIVVTCVTIAIRFTMACLALFFLPLSLIAALIYAVVCIAGRQFSCFNKGLCEKEGKRIGDKIYFLGHGDGKTKLTYSLGLIPVLLMFPWDFRGVGHGIPSND